MSPGQTRKTLKKAQKAQKLMDSVIATLSKSVPAKRSYKRKPKTETVAQAPIQAPTDGNGSPVSDVPAQA